MFKSIRNIVILGVLLALIVMTPYMFVRESSNKVTDLYKDTIIEIKDNGKIEITDKITFIGKKNKKMFVQIPTVLKTENEWKVLSNIIAKFDGQTLSYNERNETTYWASNSVIVVRDMNIIKGNMHEIEISYEYDAKDVVEEYTNISVLKILNEPIEEDIPQF